MYSDVDYQRLAMDQRLRLGDASSVRSSQHELGLDSGRTSFAGDSTRASLVESRLGLGQLKIFFHTSLNLKCRQYIRI